MPKEDAVGPGGGADQDRVNKYWPKKKKAALKAEPIKAFMTRRNKKSGKK